MDIITKEHLENLYLDEKLSISKISKQLNISMVSLRKLFTEYNIPVRSRSEAQKCIPNKSEFCRNAAEACHEKRRNNPDGYGWSMTPDANKLRVLKAQNTKLERGIPICGYQVWQQKASKQDLQKQYYKGLETRERNGTGGSNSKVEDAYYHKLVKIFGEDDVIRQYLDNDRYPFNCDFYIKSKDLFIEYQGHQSHGPAPFEPDNSEHQKFITKATFDTSTFTKRDPHKVGVAKASNIHLILIYPYHSNWEVKDGELHILENNEF